MVRDLFSFTVFCNPSNFCMIRYRRAHPFNLPAQPFNLSISDKLWTLEKNKGHFIIPEFNSSIIKWPLFFSKVHSLSDIDRLKGCAGRLKGCALRYSNKSMLKQNTLPIFLPIFLDNFHSSS